MFSLKELKSCVLISSSELPLLGEQRPAAIFIPETLTKFGNMDKEAGLPQAEDEKSILLGQGKTDQIL